MAEMIQARFDSYRIPLVVSLIRGVEYPIQLQIRRNPSFRFAVHIPWDLEASDASRFYGLYRRGSSIRSGRGPVSGLIAQLIP
jgi:hypothetical protein